MEKKFTRGMLCEEFKRKCSKCPLHYRNNSTALHCWELTNDNVNSIMNDYPYTDVKARMIFNDFETRLTAVEEKVTNDVKFTFKPGRIISGDFSTEVVDKKLYDKLQAKHEADSRLISEYDIENKKLENEIGVLNKQIDSFGLTCRLYKEERDHYKNLYSFKSDDYDRLLKEQLKTEKELKHAEEVGDRYKSLYDTTCDNYEKLYEENNKLIKENKLLSESNDTATKENLEFEGENDALSTRNAFLESAVEELEDKTVTQKNRITNLESKLRNQRANLTFLQERYEDAVKMNKARDDVYYANIKLQKTIEAKDREIGLLRAELDKYKTDDECDDRWID